MADDTANTTADTTAPQAHALVDTKVRARPYAAAAAGPSAVLSSLRYALKTSGVVRGAHVFLHVNQKDGFDCPGCAWPDPAHRATAEFCENGARAVAHEADTRKVDAAFFAKHSIAALKALSDHDLEHQGRLLQPMVKLSGASHYTPIAWDDAYALVARELKSLGSPDEAAFYTSGRASNEAAFLYQLMARAFGTNNLPDCSNMCHESSGKALGTTLGVGKGTVSLEDFDAADLIFIIGQNPGTNHPRMLSTLEQASKRGCKIVSVNPLRERALEVFAHPQRVLGILGQGAPISSHYLQVKINGDVAFLTGVIKGVLALDRAQPGVIDRAFLTGHTIGADALFAHVDAVAWADVVAGSGISQAAIEEVATLYARSERVIACWAMGLTQHKNAVGNIRSIVNLLALRGNLGKPGAGVCPVRGHSNVQGDRTMGIYESPTAAWLDRLKQGTGVASPSAHGVDVVACIQAMADGHVKVFVALGGNFAAATPDTTFTIQALSKCQLTVQIATKLNRSHLQTGAVALLLPCLGRSEIDVPPNAAGAQFVTVENSMSVVHKSEGKLTPAGTQLRSEPFIVAHIAHALLGDAQVPWVKLASDYDAIRDLIERSIDGFDRYNARARMPDGFVLPSAVRGRTWRTASGKLELTTHALPQLDVRADELVLMTIRTHDQFNTTVYEENDRYRGVYGDRRVVFMHAADLASRGLTDGARIDVTSRFGEELRTVRDFRARAYDIPRGCAAAYFPETNPLVALHSVADESHTPTSKSIVVSVRAQ